MKVLFSPSFKKKAKKLPAQAKRRLKARLALYMEDPYNDLLKNRAFGGNWGRYRTVSVDAGYRLVFRLLPEGYSFFIDAVKSK